MWANNEKLMLVTYGLRDYFFFFNRNSTSKHIKPEIRRIFKHKLSIVVSFWRMLIDFFCGNCYLSMKYDLIEIIVKWYRPRNLLSFLRLLNMNLKNECRRSLLFAKKRKNVANFFPISIENTLILEKNISQNSSLLFNPLQDGLFRGCSRMGRGAPFSPPPPKIRHTYPTMMKLCTVIPYLKMIQKMYKSRDASLDFCWHQYFFTRNQQILLHQEIHL